MRTAWAGTVSVHVVENMNIPYEASVSTVPYQIPRISPIRSIARPSGIPVTAPVTRPAIATMLTSMLLAPRLAARNP